MLKALRPFGHSDMTTATLIRLADHRRSGRTTPQSSTTAVVIPFVSRRAVLAVEAAAARLDLIPLRQAATKARAKVDAAVARGAPEVELRALRRLASTARVAEVLATARAVTKALEEACA